MSVPAVFFDRDGTLIRECGYLEDLEALSIFPWTGDALRLLTRAGFKTVVISNQSAIARGMVAESFVHDVHRAMNERLASAGAQLDGLYYCPHLVDAKVEQYRQTCRCRKPGPGMIEQACREMDLDAARSVIVGDRWLDIACGRAAGTRAVLVKTGHGADEAKSPEDGLYADAIVNNVMEAVGWILRNSSR